MVRIRWKYGLLAALLPFVCAGIAAVLFWRGILWFNNPSRQEYPVRGVDVSRYQGAIDWTLLSSQDIDFVFIKATEGSGYVDPRFQENLKGAKDAGLLVGAYHFFSFDSAPETQAENLFAQLPTAADLPPVVDLEFYGDKERFPPDPEEVWENLCRMLALLEAHYGQRPIVYTTMDCYERYLRGRDWDFDLWIRNVLRKPALGEGEDWTFWQYSHRGRLRGFSGEEPFIDLNVFCGSQEEFAAYLNQ